jgi:RecA-family ATPase
MARLSSAKKAVCSTSIWRSIPASAINRFLKIYEALGLPMKHTEDIVIWNLRGHAIPLDQLVPKLIRRVKDQNFDAIIIDPIYKVITGDENNASEMGAVL